MSEPRRLRDDGPEELRALLRAGAPARPITRAEQTRTAKRLARYASGAAVAASLSWAPGAALGAGLGVAAVAVAWGVPALLTPAPTVSAPAVTVSAPMPVRAVETATSATPEVPLPASAPSALPAARPVTSVVAPAASSGEPAAAPAVDPLAAEVELLDRARAALATSPAEALTLTEAHASSFPAGKLGMEREMVAIDALRRLGRTSEARARAEAMLARTQGGLYEPRVRKLLDQMK
ncbi:MAG: hypothetical protein QM820_25625 [Minicystis sp.]